MRPGFSSAIDDTLNQFRNFQSEDNIFGRQVSHFESDSDDQANLKNSDEEEDAVNTEEVRPQKVYQHGRGHQKSA